jgi:hypothetical protein
MAGPECPFCHIAHTEETPCPPPRAEPRPWKISRGSGSFPANYPGWCEACDSPIEPGDLVKYDAFDALIHEEDA